MTERRLNNQLAQRNHPPLNPYTIWYEEDSFGIAFVPLITSLAEFNRGIRFALLSVTKTNFRRRIDDENDRKQSHQILVQQHDHQ
jgi:hypothetical protein